MLDLNVLRSVMEHWFSLKASYSSDHYNISWSNSTLLGSGLHRSSHFIIMIHSAQVGFGFVAFR
jgi:hypothetical protein